MATRNSSTYHKKKKRKHRRRFKAWVYVVGIILVVLIILCVWRAFFASPVEKNVDLEAGSEITLNIFTDKTEEASFVTDIIAIDTSKVGSYEVVIQIGKKEVKSTLNIQDTVAPTAQAASVSTAVGAVPEAMDCVIDVVDATQVIASYEAEPDVSKSGQTEVVVLLTDEGGNVTKVPVTITITDDSEAPVITGATDKQIEVGASVSYKKDVVVTDNVDPEPELTIDNSKVDLNNPGQYPVTYTATDFAGNTSSVTITVIVTEKSVSTITDEQVYYYARPILESITNDSMSDMEVAFAIYNWVGYNLDYVNDSDKSSWQKGAYDALSSYRGDCYNYFAVAKALYNCAGIENIDVVKSNTSHSRHYWSLINLGDGWYHVDPTPRKGDDDRFFMVTDEELLSYSQRHSNSHIFDLEAYPARATTSLQDKVDYVGKTIKN